MTTTVLYFFWDGFSEAGSTAKVKTASLDAILKKTGVLTASLTALVYPNATTPAERIAYVIPERP